MSWSQTPLSLELTNRWFKGSYFGTVFLFWNINHALGAHTKD